MKTNKPWGYFEVLYSEPGTQLKRLVVNEGHALSLQRHKHRSEFMTVVSFAPEGTITIGRELNDLKEVPLESGFTYVIPVMCWHRIECSKGTVEIIEYQTGYPIFEEDIERKEDNYGRV